MKSLRSVRSPRLLVESLEHRVVFSGNPVTDTLVSEPVISDSAITTPSPAHGTGCNCGSCVKLISGSGADQQIAWALLPPDERNVPNIAGAAQFVPPYPLSDTFLLHSRPSATRKIYLDFTGHTTSNTGWNTSYNSGQPIVSPVFNFEGTSATYSSNEQQRIQGVWQRVMEDFSPFDVDVTTEDPGIGGLTYSGTGDTSWGVRVVVAADDAVFADNIGFNIGGIAYVGAYKSSIDLNCFVFAANLGNYDEKDIAEAISHEVGHTLGLDHDGNNTQGYDEGHNGAGTPGWAPIMGVGYYQELAQWSKGEYANANNQQDDLAIITNTTNNFGYRPDDAGNSVGTATPATVTNTTLSFSGVIERTTDIDVLSFQAGAGAVAININNWVNSPNLDIRAELKDAGGNSLKIDDPQNVLDAAINVNVPTAGTYYLFIEGVGVGNASTTGYSDYGSLGQYTVTGTVPLFVSEDPPVVSSITSIQSGTGTISGFRVGFNVPMDKKTLTAANIKLTSPTGDALALSGVKVINPSTYEFNFPAQKLVGQAGVRLALSPNVKSLAGNQLDTNTNNTPGELADYFAGAVFDFNSSTPGLIADNSTTDFPLALSQALNVRDVNVRVSLTHQSLGDLELQLVAPNNTVVRLFNHQGGPTANLVDTRFDEQSTKSLSTGVAPYKATVFTPDFGSTTLANLNNINSAGTWKLRVIDSLAGTSGQLDSWGITLVTDSARQSVAVNSVTPINDSSSNIVQSVSSFRVQFSKPMNPASITVADFKLLNPKNASVKIVSVYPLAGTTNQFVVTTAPWTKAGNYTVQIKPTVADVNGYSLDPNNNGTFLETGDLYSTTVSLGYSKYSTTTAPLAIPDGSRSVISSIVVPDAVTISKLAIEVNIQHQKVGDLKLTLIAPNGTSFVLANQKGGTGDHFVRTTFSNDALTSISTGTAPFVGDFLPEDSLASLLSTSAKGTWKLKVEDLTSGNAGKLISWKLFVKPT